MLLTQPAVELCWTPPQTWKLGPNLVMKYYDTKTLRAEALVSEISSWYNTHHERMYGVLEGEFEMTCVFENDELDDLKSIKALRADQVESSDGYESEGPDEESGDDAELAEAE